MDRINPPVNGLFTRLQYKILRKIAPQPPSYMTGSVYIHKSKIKTLLGQDILEKCRGKGIIDYGCGEGEEAIEIARAGAEWVIGIDIRAAQLRTAERAAKEAGASNIHFVDVSRQGFLDLANIPRPADVIVSLDAFEHFADPGKILGQMANVLSPGGRVFASFGPMWYHPLGAHMMSVFPWAHLVFSEAALCRWRADFRNDGATRFSETEGGLNCMTIRRFERLVRESAFTIEELTLIPIRKLSWAHNQLTREFTTSVVRTTLRNTDGTLFAEPH